MAQGAATGYRLCGRRAQSLPCRGTLSLVTNLLWALFPCPENGGNKQVHATTGRIKGADSQKCSLAQYMLRSQAVTRVLHGGLSKGYHTHQSYRPKPRIILDPHSPSYPPQQSISENSKSHSNCLLPSTTLPIHTYLPVASACTPLPLLHRLALHSRAPAMLT